MTATNTTATSAKAPETGTQSSTLHFGLDSIVLLKGQKAFSDQYATQRVPNIESGLGELSSGLQDSWLLQPVCQN